MEITEVRIKLMESSEDRLRGFCSVTFDTAFVVRDLKIIEGNSGPFVAMPSRKLTSNCKRCHSKNHLRANYCNNCGQKLKQIKPPQSNDGRAKLYADIAHPINAACREMIQNRVIAELEKERKLSGEPGYRSRYDETYDAGPSADIEEESRRHGVREGSPEKDSPAEADVSRADASHRGPSRPHIADHHAKPNPPAAAQPADQIDAAEKLDSEETPANRPPRNEASDDFGKGIFD